VYWATLEGPQDLAPGASARFTATLYGNDGSVQRSGPDNRSFPPAVWATSDRSVLTVDSSGQATATAKWGLSNLAVTITTPSQRQKTVAAAREVIVQPAGTFRYTGFVQDAEIPDHGISGAVMTVRLTDDPAGPVVASLTTTDRGAFRFYGLPADGVMHITREGYRPFVERFHLEPNGIRHYHMVVSDGARWALDGTYTMTVEATRCPATRSLPLELRRRQYTAVITQSGPNLTFTLAEAAFHTSEGQGNRFTGVVSPSRLEVQMRGFYDSYYYTSAPVVPDIAEVLPDGSVLVLTGSGTLTGNPDELTGTLGGQMSLYARPTFPNVQFLSSCETPRVTLTKR
jgi:hypothetical protein